MREEGSGRAMIVGSKCVSGIGGICEGKGK